MASGVGVDDQVKEIFNEMKVVKSNQDHSERIRLVVFQIKDSFIRVEEGKIFRQKDLDGVTDVFKFFLKTLENDKCRYLLYDCHYETKESSKKEELVFVMWAPEGAAIKEKMHYASSKSAIKSIMGGLKHELQMNDLSDCGDRNCFAEKLGGGSIIKIEGHPVKPELCEHDHSDDEDVGVKGRGLKK